MCFMYCLDTQRVVNIHEVRPRYMVVWSYSHYYSLVYICTGLTYVMAKYQG